MPVDPNNDVLATDNPYAGWDLTPGGYSTDYSSLDHSSDPSNPNSSGGGLPLGWLSKLGKLFGGGSNMSGWGSILKALGPSLISGIAGYFTNRSAKKLTPAEQQSQDLILQQLKALLPFGQGMMSKGAQASNQAMKFYQNTAANPRQSMTPELNEQAASDRATMASVGEMGAPGGASSDFLSRLPFMRAGNTTNAIFAARNNANDKIATLGQNMMNTGLQAASGGRAGAGTLLDFGLNKSYQAFDQGSKSAKGVYQLVQGIVDSYNRSKQGNGFYDSEKGLSG